MKALLIPVKDPARGKSRLAELLSAQERAQLAWAMLEDVCRAAAAAAAPDQVFLVTCYARAVESARRLGWEPLIEETQESESMSVDWASSILARRGFDTVMRLPADIPLVQASDIDGLFAVSLTSPGALLAPSYEGTGTNAIIRTPPNLFRSRFGPNSLALHKQEAARAGVECTVLENPRIALDIDELADLKLLLQSGVRGETALLLAEMRIAERMKFASDKL